MQRYPLGVESRSDCIVEKVLCCELGVSVYRMLPGLPGQLQVLFLPCGSEVRNISQQPSMVNWAQSAAVS